MAPFPREERWPVPLALYCTPGRIEIGKAAERATAHNVPGAFKEWFRHLSSVQTVKYLGQQQPVSHLLLLAAEEQFRKFLREVRMNMDGGLENCRAAMPLALSFEDDVDDSMRIFLVNLFRNMGYGRVQENFHNRIIASHYFSKIPTERILIADSDGVDLTLSLYERGRDQAKCSNVIQGAGSDPRIQRVCNMIWDKTGAEYSFLDRANEQPLLEQMALEVIGANQTEFEGIMNYSNGEELCFMISRSELVGAGAGTKSTSSDVIRFLEKAGIAPSDVTMLLRNLAAKNQPLQAAFTSSIIFDEDAQEEVNQDIVTLVMSRFADAKVEPKPMRRNPLDHLEPSPIVSKDELKEKTKKWRQVKAEAGGKSRSGRIAEALMILDRFLAECRSCSGSEELIIEIEGEKDSLNKTTPPPPPPVDGSAVRALNRRWREVRASAKGKKNTGNFVEAIRILKSFADEADKVYGAEEILKSVKDELDLMVGEAKDRRPSKPSISNRTKAEPAREPKPEPNNQGQELVRQGKLKEARDWFRSQNNNTMARALTEIFRSQKGIELRKTTLEECRKSKNKEQISRIIREIRDYIDLCEEAGVNTEEYKKLLSDYRKI